VWVCFANVLLVFKISFETSGPSPDCNVKHFGWTFLVFLVAKRDQRSAFTTFKNLKANQNFVVESWN
jgi:hypothetical protein